MDRLEARALALARRFFGPKGHAERMTRRLGIRDPETGKPVDRVEAGRCLVGLMVPIEGITEELRKTLNPSEDQKSVFVILGEGEDFVQAFLATRETIARQIKFDTQTSVEEVDQEGNFDDPDFGITDDDDAGPDDD